MGFKYKLKVCSVILVLIIGVMCSLSGCCLIDLLNDNDYLDMQNSEKYTEMFIDVFKELEEAQVSDIFAFDFDRAYVFNDVDCYLSGEAFAKSYDLNINIDDIPESWNDAANRIAFVDENGDMVNWYKYNYAEVDFVQKGMIIYPDTKIFKCVSNEKLMLKFDSEEYYSEEVTE